MLFVSLQLSVATNLVRLQQYDKLVPELQILIIELMHILGVYYEFIQFYYQHFGEFFDNILNFIFKANSTKSELEKLLKCCILSKLGDPLVTNKMFAVHHAYSFFF